jgi:hypothetical protein
MRWEKEIRERIEEYAKEKNDWFQIIEKAPAGSAEKESAYKAKEIVMARIYELQWCLGIIKE